MLQYITIPVTPFEQNCSIIWCDQTNTCALVDAGGDSETLIATVTQHRLKPSAVLLTHGHLDHVGGATQIAQHYQIPIIGPQQEDKFWLDALEQQAQRFGFPPSKAFVPDQWLQHGDTVSVGNEVLEVRYTPGHTPGHVVFYSKSAKMVFVGDVLFAGSIGRTDFLRGSHSQLIHSIKTQLLVLADDVVVVPGHGSNTSIGHERQTNPYF